LNEEETLKSVAYNTVFAHVRYDHPKLLVGLPNSFTIRHGSMLLTDFRHWNDDYQLAVCSFHFQPTSVSWRSQGLGLGSVGDEQYWVVVLRVLDSPILRTVVPGVELQKHTKTEICLGQGEHSLYTPFQSEVIDMRCCLRLRLSPAFAMRHDISPNCR